MPKLKKEVTDDMTRWLLDNELHRDDGPAIIKNNGYKAYYLHGKRHRKNGPAIISGDFRVWCQNDVIHRDDGPAVEGAKNSFCKQFKEWWIGGKQLTETEFNEYRKNTLKNESENLIL